MKKLCVIMVDGGFCSVLTKFALGFAIQKNGNILVKYDLSWFKKNSLGCDNISDRSFKLKEAFPKLDFKVATKIDILFSKIISYQKNETPFIFDEKYLIPSSGYLDGYYSHWKYLQAAGTDFLQELNIQNIKMDHINLKVLKKIKSVKDSIAVHVRRGDFVKLNNTILNREYYIAAINHIIKKHNLKDPFIFFFSDDIKWVQINLADFINKKFNFQVVDCNDQSQGYKDLFLISSCQYIISSNSSFGFWGGVLNKNPQKDVLIPSLWYQDPPKNPILKGHEQAFRMPGFSVFSVKTLNET